MKKTVANSISFADSFNNIFLIQFTSWQIFFNIISGLHLDGFDNFAGENFAEFQENKSSFWIFFLRKGRSVENIFWEFTNGIKKFKTMKIILLLIVL